MRKLVGIVLLGAAAAAAQTAQTRVYRAFLTPGGTNEGTPAGVATVRALAVRDAMGTLQSGSVDFGVNYNFTEAQTFQGLRIESAQGSATSLINTDLTAQRPVQGVAGQGAFSRQVQIQTTNPLGLAGLGGIWQNPSQQTVTLTTANATYSGVLVPATEVVVMALMQPENEVPPIRDLAASAVGAATLLTTRGTNNALTSAVVEFDVQYSFPRQTTITGLHIHKGEPGANGPVVLPSGISTMMTPAAGQGRIQARQELNISTQNVIDAVEAMARNPRGYYMNLHTAEYPGGAMRGQTRRTDLMVFPLSLQSNSVVPPLSGLNASGLGQFTLRTLRDFNGRVSAAFGEFSGNFQLPELTTLTGIQINEAAAGENGPARIDIGAAGSQGTVFQRGLLTGLDVIGALRLLVENPNRYYFNVLTSANPQGALRAQIGTLLTGPPTITGINGSSVGDGVSALPKVAAGQVFTITGENFTIAGTDLSGWEGRMVPATLNGVEVVVDNAPIPLLAVSPTRIVAQMPFEAAIGGHPIEARFNGLVSAAKYVEVVAVAPLLFEYPNGVLGWANTAIPSTDMGVPVSGGSEIMLYATGLGQTSPGVTTGQPVASDMPYNTSPLTVTIGGQPARVRYAYAAPGMVGLYQIGVQIPTGLKPGSQPVSLSLANTPSNTINISAR
ncbi:MAG: CHRD domain-containing protein [Bryobacterales bacterium]|nr:CHRD domain-containing protein [Bryobacterales bacterium]